LFLIQTLPPTVRRRITPRERQSARAFQRGDWNAAFNASASVYQILLETQPTGHRFHKGAPLMAMGSARLNAGRGVDGFPFVLDAFIEDVLSRGEESPESLDELSRPAAITLVYSYSLPGRAIADLAMRLRQSQRHGRLWQDPAEARAEEPIRLGEVQSISEQEGTAAAQASEPPIRISAWRTPGRFGTPYDERVFVGGSYSPALLPVLSIIRDVVRERGLDGVVAAEFKGDKREAETNYADAILLLRGCSAAIFDVSERSGQLQELQEALHLTMERVLVVHASAATLSTMTIGAARKLRAEPQPYESLGDLRRIVDEWLSSTFGLGGA
jgi:hypothetical protein